MPSDTKESFGGGTGTVGQNVRDSSEMSAWPKRGGATRERERIAIQVGKAVEKAVHESSETWPLHHDERGMVGDLVGVLQRNIGEALTKTDVTVEVETTTVTEEKSSGADLEIRARTPYEPYTKRIVLQAKREDKLTTGAPSKIRQERDRLAKQIANMRHDAPNVKAG